MQMDDPITDKRRIRGKAKWLVYINHFIVGWDDNIWMFAMGLFLIEITPESLQFTATYGLVGGIAVLLFGTVVGDWVDKTSRLTVARVSVLVQNSAVIVCCILIYIVLEYKETIAGALPSEGLLRMCYAFIVLIAVFSNLTHMARTTAIERDWIVEICDKDKDMLARLSATMRRISLLTMVVAPVVTGQVLSRTSHSFGALLIAGWNVLTIFAEYALLIKVYEAVPQLHREKKREERHQEIVLMEGVDVAVEFTQVQSDNFDIPAETIGKLNEIPIEPVEVVHELKRPRYTFWTSLCASAITLRRGWKIYTGYDVMFAGLSLASLYLTVLSFHSVTVGFAYSQGLSEDLIGGLLAVAACSGIVGTFLFPYVRFRIGLQRTGLYALAGEISSLTLCVVSIFCPGSPFELLKGKGSGLESSKEHLKNFSDVNWSANLLDNSTQLSNNSSWGVLDQSLVSSYISISLLLTGIIGARIGLWMADLTITQLFLESVDVTERGIVAGVQNALNQLMDMLQYAIVILLPVPEQFGYLVILSYCFICIGWILFAVYVKRTRGYVFPWFRPKKQQTDTDVCRENY